MMMMYTYSNPHVHMSANLRVEVEEAVRTVDIVERSKAGHRSVNVHGMDVHASPATQEYPLRIGPTHKHLHQHTSCITHTAVIYI